MRNWIKRGDAYGIPISLTLNGEKLDLSAVETVEVCIGDLRRVYPGEITYDEDADELYFPVTQEETFAMEENSAVSVDVRVRFVGGSVIGSRLMKYMPVYDAASEVTI